MLLDAGAWTSRPIGADDRAGVVRAGQEPSIAGQIPWFPQPFPGAATSAVKAACDWASANLAPAMIRAKTPASNTASQRVLLASGFAEDGGDDRFRFFVRP